MTARQSPRVQVWQARLEDLFFGPRLRIPLLLLQGLLCVLMTTRLSVAAADPAMLATEGGILLVGSIVLATFVLISPTRVVQHHIFIAGLTLINTIMVTGANILMGVQDGQALSYMVLLLLAGCSAGLLQLLGLAFFVCAAYVTAVVMTGTWSQLHLLTVPILLVLTLFTARGWHRSRGTEPEGFAQCDPVTGLPSRVTFLGAVERAMAMAQKHAQARFAVAFLDLDGFKAVNDRLGHKAGDAVLKEAARRIQGCLRKEDLLCRYGGDEFTILLGHLDTKEGATRVVSRILKSLQQPMMIDGRVVQIGASIGLALSTNVSSRPEDLIRDADVAMYRVKSNGKQGFAVSNQLGDTAPILAETKTTTRPPTGSDRPLTEVFL